jgi:hypothetical protein
MDLDTQQAGQVSTTTKSFHQVGCTIRIPKDIYDTKKKFIRTRNRLSCVPTLCCSTSSTHTTSSQDTRQAVVQLPLIHTIKYFYPAVDIIRIDIFRFVLDDELEPELRKISKLGTQLLGLPCERRRPRTPNFLRLTSDQVGIPAELKHINKRRKRHQQGLPSLLKFPMNPLSSAVTLVGLCRK